MLKCNCYKIELSYTLFNSSSLPSWRPAPEAQLAPAATFTGAVPAAGLGGERKQLLRYWPPAVEPPGT